MIHQRQILEVIDPPNDKRKVDYFDVSMVVLSLVGLFLFSLMYVNDNQLYITGILIVFVSILLSVIKNYMIFYRDFRIGPSRIILKADEIEIECKEQNCNMLLRLQDIKYLSIRYSGYDEGPRHIVWAPRAKKGNGNIFVIESATGIHYESEFYLKNKRQAQLLRNNAFYYQDKLTHNNSVDIRYQQI